MKGSSRALFQAVVVMGAALACDRSAAPETRPEVRAEPVVEPVRPVVVEPAKPVVGGPVAEPAEAEPVAAAAPEVVEPQKKPRTKPKDSREKCPEGSEMPYPPCFYIL